MVAILVVLTITVLLLIDWSVQLIQAKRARKRAAAGNPHNGIPPASNPFNPPQGLFFHPSHSWAHVEPNGDVKVGLDGLVGFLLGSINHVDLPAPGQKVREGDSVAVLRQGSRELRLLAPVEGEIVAINDELLPDGHFIRSDPYGAGWVCEIRPRALSKDLQGLMIGEDLAGWHSNEARRIIKFLSHAESGSNVGGSGNGSASEYISTEGLLLRGFMEGASDDEWRMFQSRFMDSKLGGEATR